MERFVISIRSISFSRETAAPARCWPACLVGVVARHRALQSVQPHLTASAAWLGGGALIGPIPQFIWQHVEWFFIYNMNNKDGAKGKR